MKILFALTSLFLAACSSGGGSSSSSPVAAIQAPENVIPTYVYKVIGNNVTVASDVYTNFAESSQTQLNTGNIVINGEQDFTVIGDDTLGYWALNSSGVVEVQLWKNGAMIDDQTNENQGTSLQFRDQIPN